MGLLNTQPSVLGPQSLFKARDPIWVNPQVDVPADGTGGCVGRVVLIINDAKLAMGLAGRDRRGLFTAGRAMVFDQHHLLDRAATG